METTAASARIILSLAYRLNATLFAERCTFHDRRRSIHFQSARGSPIGIAVAAVAAQEFYIQLARQPKLYACVCDGATDVQEYGTISVRPQPGSTAMHAADLFSLELVIRTCMHPLWSGWKVIDPER